MKLIEEILATANVKTALERVVSNKGAAGIDGVKVEELRDYMSANWLVIRLSILDRTYNPAPVRRVEIPKSNGGVRKLGIPTVIDRTLQQAIVQVLSPIFEKEFQENSYGFRPGRSCEQAILKLTEYLNEGYEWIVDIDLEKFFDNVPQDKLMSYVGRVIHTPDTESLIRKYLKSGVMENGIYSATGLGTPQGGNLSPLLSNVMLNELAKELVKRGLRYVRYADDCVIAVGSSASANRVMRTITEWIERKLGLKVNATKTHVCRPNKLKFGLKGKMEMTDEHLRTMLRKVIWKQWKTPQKRAWGLRKLGVFDDFAKLTSYCGDRYEWVVRRTCVARAISKDILTRRGLVSCLDYYQIRHALKTN